MDLDAIVLKSVQVTQNRRIQAVSNGIVSYAMEKGGHDLKHQSEYFSFKTLTEAFNSANKLRFLQLFQGVQPNKAEFKLVVDVLVKNGFLIEQNGCFLARDKLKNLTLNNSLEK